MNDSSSDKIAQSALDTVSNIDRIVRKGVADEPLTFDAPVEQEPEVRLTDQQKLEQEIRFKPANPEPYLQLAEIYKSSGRWQEARRVAENGVEHNENSSKLLELYEDIQLELSHQALNEARAIAARKPTESAHDAVGQCEVDLSNLKVSVCEARYRRDPSQVELLIPLAIGLRQLKRHDEAVNRLREATQFPEVRARAYLQLGMCLQHLGKQVQAITCYRRAALFRAPEAPQDLKVRALQLASDLAEQIGLFDSSIYYLSKLEELVTADQKNEIAAKRKRLQALLDTPPQDGS